MSARKSSIIGSSGIENRIYLLRGQRVLLDSDLAELYDVPTKVLLQAVRRNQDRFPADFMFQLANHEVVALRSQFVTSSNASRGHGGRRTVPNAFTEQGVAMLSSVLSSARAIAVNIEIMRTFVRIRETIAANKELAAKLDELERKVLTHDQAIVGLITAIRDMTVKPEPKRRPIGFILPKDD